MYELNKWRCDLTKASVSSHLYFLIIKKKNLFNTAEKIVIWWHLYTVVCQKNKTVL